MNCTVCQAREEQMAFFLNLDVEGGVESSENSKSRGVENIHTYIYIHIHTSYVRKIEETKRAYRDCVQGRDVLVVKRRRRNKSSVESKEEEKKKTRKKTSRHHHNYPLVLLLPMFCCCGGGFSIPLTLSIYACYWPCSLFFCSSPTVHSFISLHSIDPLLTLPHTKRGGLFRRFMAMVLLLSSGAGGRTFLVPATTIEWGWAGGHFPDTRTCHVCDSVCPT